MFADELSGGKHATPSPLTVAMTTVQPPTTVIFTSCIRKRYSNEEEVKMLTPHCKNAFLSSWIIILYKQMSIILCKCFLMFHVFPGNSCWQTGKKPERQTHPPPMWQRTYAVSFWSKWVCSGSLYQNKCVWWLKTKYIFDHIWIMSWFKHIMFSTTSSD